MSYNEKQVGEVVLKAMGQAISKTVAIAKIIKKRIPGLHQETSISSMSITDMWEPMEEGLVPYAFRHSYVGDDLPSVPYFNLSVNQRAKQIISWIFRDQAPSHDQQNQYQSQQQQNQMHVPVTGLLKTNPFAIGFVYLNSQGIHHPDSYGRGRINGRGRGQGWGRTCNRNYPVCWQRMVVIGIRGEEVDEAEVGAIVVGMEGAGVEGKAMVMDEDGAVAVDMVVDNRLNSGIVLMVSSLAGRPTVVGRKFLLAVRSIKTFTSSSFQFIFLNDMDVGRH
ncbi:DNA/RNA-binding protein Alba-like - like 4 [Theobroma cacao]|nr:DNA/RNA-binding protein Alba-like - like 4 [Theobroma cacao]